MYLIINVVKFSLFLDRPNAASWNVILLQSIFKISVFLFALGSVLDVVGRSFMLVSKPLSRLSVKIIKIIYKH